jgi:hypothetical protein
MEDTLFKHADCEPSLDEALADPIVQQLMRSDGVTEEAVRRLIQENSICRCRLLC